MRKIFGTIFIVIIVASFAGCLMIMSQFSDQIEPEQILKGEAVLQMKLEGVIISPEKFLKDLRKYSKKEDIKGILIIINSPGGVVGPSQELYSEIKRVRDELKKPVVVTVSGLAASGAYYAAVGADQIYTNPGSLIGSIGVIMEFANLEKLYDWAKIKRYAIKTGKYKDSGAEYRPMRPDERALFQDLADDVLAQFKEAVMKGRKLRKDVVDAYADGRVFSGKKAVELGFADHVGDYTDALRALGQLTDLGDSPKIFVPPPEKPDFREFLMNYDSKANVVKSVRDTLNLQLLGQPLYLMPGSLAR